MNSFIIENPSFPCDLTYRWTLIFCRIMDLNGFGCLDVHIYFSVQNHFIDTPGFETHFLFLKAGG